MKTNIPIRFTDNEQIEQIAKDIWQGKEETDLNLPKTHDQDEEVQTINTDTKTIAIFVLSVVIVVFMAGWFMRDYGLQDGLNRINDNKKEIRISEWIINKETRSIEIRNKDTETVKETLKKSYNISVQ